MSSGAYPKTRTFAELLIDAEVDPYLRAVLVGRLRERCQGSSRQLAQRDLWNSISDCRETLDAVDLTRLVEPASRPDGEMVGETGPQAS